MDHLMAATWTRRQARPDALPVSGTGPGRELAAGTESGERRCDGLASAGASAACHVSGRGASVPAPLRRWLAGPPSQPEASSISCTVQRAPSRREPPISVRQLISRSDCSATPVSPAASGVLVVASRAVTALSRSFWDRLHPFASTARRRPVPFRHDRWLLLPLLPPTPT